MGGAEFSLNQAPAEDPEPEPTPTDCAGTAPLRVLNNAEAWPCTAEGGSVPASSDCCNMAMSCPSRAGRSAPLPLVFDRAEPTLMVELAARPGFGADVGAGATALGTSLGVDLTLRLEPDPLCWMSVVTLRLCVCQSPPIGRAISCGASGDNRAARRVTRVGVSSGDSA